jgi:tRNA dimethylallyltransferase
MTAAVPPLLVVVGPTASGKTELAVELAEQHGGEIVSADSVQVYRHFELGTGKPSAEERARAPHHLIDIAEPDQALDAASWAELAAESIAAIRARGRRPIVCGGTFLWIRALLFGLAPAPPGDAAIRARHAELTANEGRPALHAALARVDPDAASKLMPNDFVRVSRALEVFELTGVPLSRFQAGHGFREPRFAARLVGLARTREELDARIAARARQMLDAGWIDEVARLLARGFGASRAMGSVGYKQIAEALASGATPDPDALHLAIVRATRVFARRQRTWLRDRPVEWIARARDLRVRPFPGEPG